MNNREGVIELQKIDCNCNDCKYMERDFATYKKWEEWHRNQDLRTFDLRKAKALKDAQGIEDAKQRESALHIVEKMKFQFDKSNLLHYGRCRILQMPVSFIPNTFQAETQTCFEHRRVRHEQRD